MMPINSGVKFSDDFIAVARYGTDANLLKSLGDFDSPTEFRDDDGSGLLHVCAEHGRHTGVIYLLNSGCWVNQRNLQGDTPLILAVKAKKIDAVMALLLGGANPMIRNKRNEGPLECSKAFDNTGIFKVLVSAMIQFHGMSIEMISKILLFNDLFLYNAAFTENTKLVRLLCREGKDTNEADADGHVAIHAAIVQGDVKMIKCLLELGADVTILDKENNSLLHYEGQNHHGTIISLLLSTGQLDINARNIAGLSPLHIAVKSMHFLWIKALLENGADANAKNDQGETPLRWMVESYNEMSSRRTLQHFLLSRQQYEYVLERQEQALRLMAPHITVLEEIGEPMHEQIVKACPKISGDLEKCRLELAELRESIICDSISFFDVLVGTVKVVTCFVRNPKFSRALQCLEYRSLFPLFGDMLGSKLDEATRKHELLERCKAKLENTLFFNFPDTTEQIFKYLDTRDLRNLCLAYE